MKRNGFGLLEVLIASGIIVLTVAAVVGLSQFVVRGYVTTGARITAYQLAQQGTEIVRSIRDTAVLDAKPATDWQTGIPVSANAYRPTYQTSCGQSAVCPWGLTTGSEAIALDGIQFTRSIFVESAGLTNSTEDANTRRVKVLVSWTEGIRQQSVEITTFVTNWRLET